MASLPFRKLERNLRLGIVTISMCLVTWLILANGRRWQERQRPLMSPRNHDTYHDDNEALLPRDMEQTQQEQLKNRSSQKDGIPDDPLHHSMGNLMAWSPRQIRNLTHPFTTEMSRYGGLRVIPVLYKKQLTAEERRVEGNVYRPGRDVIVAHGVRNSHGGRRENGKDTQPAQIPAEEMAAIKRTLERRLREHAQRLSTEPISFDKSDVPPVLRYLDPKIIEIFPEKFSEEYKNPCWWESSSLQCVPYFYIGGAPKCATTDMWNRFSGHPDVIRSFGKESHFWSRGNHSEKEVYTFLGRNKRVFKNQGGPFSESAKMRVSMDASACTFWHNYRAARILGNPPEGPPIILADVMRAAQPGAKFIFILRNPTERQYSEYLDIDDLWKGKVKSPLDFHSRIENRIRLLDLCLRENTLRHCVAINATPRLHISMYSVHLREWFQRFPREQIHILRTDEWKQNVTRELNNILRFLDLPILNDVQLKEIIHADNAGVRSPRNVGMGPMFPQTKALLDDYFSVFRADLANLLKDDRYLWSGKT